jgi:hypothetical protein
LNSDTSKPLDNKPKLFKGSATNPFAKRTAGSSAFGGLGSAATNVAPKSEPGLFYPGSQTAKPADPPANQFSSITSFGNRNDVVKVSERERKSSSNIEEAYDDDDFDEESLGNSQLNPSAGTPINNWNTGN